MVYPGIKIIHKTSLNGQACPKEGQNKDEKKRWWQKIK
jgi:hypothetical protein